MGYHKNDFLSLLEIGIALTGEKDRNKLLDMILQKSMEIAACDAGTLYILKDDSLHFKIMKTISQGIDNGRNGEEINLPPVPLKEENICAYTAIHKKSVNIPDVYDSKLFDFSGPIKYDKMTGYHTGSMLAIPLLNQDGETVGVLQLINAMDEEGKIIAFDASVERILFALASQAAIAISNMQYVEEIKEQMWSFTEAMTEAIDARTPYNGSHTRMVAKYAGMMADHINELYKKGKEEEFFSTNRKEQLVMSALLHDIGKMVVPTKVMNKATRLGDALERIENRLTILDLKTELGYKNQELNETEFHTLKQQISKTLETVKKADGAGFLTDELEEALKECFTYTYLNGEEAEPFLTEEEKECLSVKKGTLTAKERAQMESHVEMTERILSRVHFNSYFKDSPIWAAQHHECINGKGYPKHLSGDELPFESRILAVADICDALLATDRPYKKPIPMEKAFFIMEDMAACGNIDAKLVGYLKECLNQTEDEKV